MSETRNLLVSIIVPTNNSESTIGKCLESIDNQSYKNIEIIVMDNNSSDDTKDIVERYGAHYIEDNSIRSRARNIGADKSKGMFILSIDSDMELSKTVVEECIKKSKDFHSIIIPEISFGSGFWAKCKAVERSCYIGDDIIEAARFFDKEVFWEIGGYDEQMVNGEDWNLSHKVKNAGYKISRIGSLIKHYEGRLSLLKI